MTKRHRHEWSLLYSHFGKYGDQDAHIHGCLVEDCEAWLIGKGRKCDGVKATHHIDRPKASVHGSGTDGDD